MTKDLHKLPGPELAKFARQFVEALPKNGDITILILALSDRFNPALKGQLPERPLGKNPP